MKKLGIYIAAAAGFAIYGAVTDADRDGAGNIVDAGNVDAFQVQAGDCFDDAGSYDAEITSLPGVPCSEPHDNEAFKVLDLTIASYPGDEAMSEVAYDACMEHFESFVGRDYESSSLDILTLYPSRESWRQNDREIVCAVYDVNATKLVGSVEGRGL